MMRADDLPSEPDMDVLSSLQAMPTMIERLNERLKVDDRGSDPICHVRLGSLLPGETGRAQDDLAILPSGAGSFMLKVRILAGEINPPLNEDYLVQVSGPIRKMDFEQLKELIVAEYISDE